MVAERLLGDPVARGALARLHRKSVNFDPPEREELATEGWRVDAYCQPLPSEPAGPPVPGGAWETARRLMRDYEFADPSIVRAIYHRDDPLEGRDMLLELRFHGLRFHVGVRVAGVRDETCVLEGGSARIWGWNYRTLQGHLEMGQMDYELWKWLETGEVQFRIRAYSRRARIGNPLVRLGFQIFGRREQVRFARHACERMARLVAEDLSQATAGEMPRAGDTVAVGTAPRADGLRDRLEAQANGASLLGRSARLAGSGGSRRRDGEG